MLEIILVLLLSIVPFIENRGAMFVGFAIGVTNLPVYLIGTLLNILIVPFYLKFLPKFNFLKIPTLDENTLRNGPTIFALLIPGTANGINALTSSTISRQLNFDFLHSFTFISGGIILRGAVTYLLLVGSLTFSDVLHIGNALTAVTVAIALFFILPHIIKQIKRNNG
ncbi:hypothetical protein GF318_02165 [Candidatus Micrarchaeota archaeon]|nr:hypothetical protein [Candidatus Micrarchaeota archaeon]